MHNRLPARQNKAAVKALNTRSILDAALDGRDLTPTEALHLLSLEKEAKQAELAELREAADVVRQNQVGESVLYTTGASLFLTNLCEMAPTLYPYPKTPGQEHLYTLTIDDLDACLETVQHRSLSRLTIRSGGLWPYLQVPGLESPNILKTYANVFAYAHERVPDVTLAGLSPDEIDFLCILADRDAQYVLELLMDQGLHVLDGVGAEVLVDTVRHKVSPRKATVKRWLEIVAQAYKLNLPVTAKLEAGPLETLSQRVTHLERLRTFLRKYPGAFCTWAPHMWTRKPAQPYVACATAPHTAPVDRLKLIAVARLFLGADLPNQQGFWQITKPERQAVEESQDGLQWGVNHFGGTDALAYPAFLAGSRDTVLWTEAELQALIGDTGRPTTMEP